MRLANGWVKIASGGVSLIARPARSRGQIWELARPGCAGPGRIIGRRPPSSGEGIARDRTPTAKATELEHAIEAEGRGLID
ncbi:hypothetical protein B0H17DRAFT_1223293 [Mycena rosella]|uniref:Uncharacterized protein n=1 Tax=Mycena rosella TaxID=1033263 RepID=A0AAD7F764_MYCRO|nr:hypothetical protein B0H17DRAFT_1223293 [Mycena rosella]